MRGIPGKDVRRGNTFCGFKSRRFLRKRGIMNTDKLHKWYDYLPDPKRFFVMLGLIGPIILLGVWNLFIAFPILIVIAFDRFRFLRKHGAL